MSEKMPSAIAVLCMSLGLDPERGTTALTDLINEKGWHFEVTTAVAEILIRLKAHGYPEPLIVPEPERCCNCRTPKEPACDCGCFSSGPAPVPDVPGWMGTAKATSTSCQHVAFGVCWDCRQGKKTLNKKSDPPDDHWNDVLRYGLQSDGAPIGKNTLAWMTKNLPGAPAPIRLMVSKGALEQIKELTGSIPSYVVEQPAITEARWRKATPLRGRDGWQPDADVPLALIAGPDDRITKTNLTWDNPGPCSCGSVSRDKVGAESMGNCFIRCSSCKRDTGTKFTRRDALAAWVNREADGKA